MSVPSIDRIEFRGGRLCLDFINTTNWVSDDPVDDRLSDTGALATWLKRQGLGVLDDTKGNLNKLTELRRIVRLLFTRPEAVTNDQVAEFNAMRNHPAPLDLSAGSASLKGPISVETVARIIADSSAQLLLANQSGRVKMCPGDRCGWLFFDESPTNRRRWCSMADCGNKAKAKRFYHAHRNPQES